MEIGIDSFAGATVRDADGKKINHGVLLRQLVDRIRLADSCGLDVFGIGEHHRADFLDSSPTHILAAAATQTRRIRLTTAVTVLSAADPVRVFQNHATLDLLSEGRAEIVAGRGSFVDAYPLFGLSLQDYDDLFEEKIDLLLRIREQERISWKGRHRPELREQGVYPRPIQPRLPIWIGVGGSPQSFVRAGILGLPLMIAVIGGDMKRFRPLVDLYRRSGQQAGHPPEALKVGLHALGYVSDSYERAVEEYFPGYARSFSKIGQERGWSGVTRENFERQAGAGGAITIGSPPQVAAKILSHSEDLGGIARFTFQMEIADLPHYKLCHAIERIGSEAIPHIRVGTRATS